MSKLENLTASEFNALVKRQKWAKIKRNTTMIAYALTLSTLCYLSAIMLLSI